MGPHANNDVGILTALPDRSKQRLEARDAVNEVVREKKTKVEAAMMEMEMEKWITHFDPYTDLPYYEHVETGEVRHA